MANGSGLFLAIEGTDSATKAAQLELLVTKLKEQGYQVHSLQFPRYQQPSSYFARRYLEGIYGQLTNVGPYTSSLFFALDRFEAAQEIRQALSENKVVIADRYSGSNMATQGAKISEAEQRRGFFLWLDNLEFEMLKIPRPQRSLVLKTSTDMLQPSPSSPIALTNQAYDDLCQLFPKDFRAIDCMREGKKLDAETIHRLIWQNIEPDLPPQPNREIEPDTGMPLTDNNPKSTKKSVSGLLVPHLLNEGYRPSNKTNQLGFFMPKKLSRKTSSLYERTMQVLIDTHQDISAKLDNYNQSLSRPFTREYIQSVAESMLPLAITTSLTTDKPPNLKLSELQAKPSTKDISTKINNLAGKFLENNYDDAVEGLELVSVSPRNELDLVPAILYQYAHSPSDKLAAAVAKMPYIKKEGVLKAYLAAKDRSILKDISYTWDILSSYQVMTQLLKLQPGRDFQMQLITPRYGYDVPSVIDDAELTDQFLACFDASLELHSTIQSSAGDQLAQYAALRGHRLRWKISYNALEMSEILAKDNSSLPKNDLYRRLIDQIREKLAEVHPLIYS